MIPPLRAENRLSVSLVRCEKPGKQYRQTLKSRERLPVYCAWCDYIMHEK
jgi:hypothetical protein